MIPAIGFMVAAYILTRMIEIVTRQPQPARAVVMCATVTIIVTLLCAASIFTSSSDATRLLNTLPRP